MIARIAVAAAAAATFALAAFSVPAVAAPRTLDPAEFQSFLGNWTPPEAPFCAVLKDGNAWSAVMHPAAVMGGNKPFGPAPEFWDRHALLLFARVVPSAAGHDVFHVEAVRRGHKGLEVRLSMMAPPMASPGASQVKVWTGVVVDRSVPQQVRFIENGQPVCAVDLGNGFTTPPMSH